jgi:hypothetical protein
MPQTITGIIMETRSTFASGFPDIPIAETVISELGDNPMFVTLPIGRVDTTSRNGRRYTRESVQALVDAVNSEKSIGQKGHLRDDERAYRFDIPPLMWLGATLEADGTAWGKAYVMESAPDVREYIRVAKINNAKVGTSIYGTATIEDDGTVRDLQIESIDLAHPGRLGVEMAGAVPTVTQETVTGADADQPAETHDSSSDTQPTEEDTSMGDNPTNETNTAPPSPDMQAHLREMRESHQAEVSTLTAQIAELQGRTRDLSTIAELLQPVEGDTLASKIEALLAAKTSLQAENRDLLASAIAHGVAEAVTLETARPIIESLVTAEQPSTREDVASAIDKVLGRDDVKAMLRTRVIEESGPQQQRPVTPASPADDAAGQPEPLIFIPLEA